jgi:hypothetical protein
MRGGDRARVDRYSSLAIVPVELPMIVMGRENLQASGRVREGVLRRELDRPFWKVVFG